MQIIFAVMILAYSLLLSTGRFETRAEKMLACGIVLSRLMRNQAQRDKPAVARQHLRRYLRALLRLLEKFENHTELDYHAAMTDLLARKGIPKRAPNQTRWPYVWSVVTYLSAIAMRRLKINSCCGRLSIVIISLRSRRCMHGFVL